MQVDEPPSNSQTTIASSSTDERGGSNSSDDGNGCGGSSCSWNGSTISAGSGCMENNDSRSEASQDDASEGGTNDGINEEDYTPTTCGL